MGWRCDVRSSTEALPKAAASGPRSAASSISRSAGTPIAGRQGQLLDEPHDVVGAGECPHLRLEGRGAGAVARVPEHLPSGAADRLGGAVVRGDHLGYTKSSGALRVVWLV